MRKAANTRGCEGRFGGYRENGVHRPTLPTLRSKRQSSRNWPIIARMRLQGWSEKHDAIFLRTESVCTGGPRHSTGHHGACNPFLGVVSRRPSRATNRAARRNLSTRAGDCCDAGMRCCSCKRRKADRVATADLDAAAPETARSLFLRDERAARPPIPTAQRGTLSQTPRAPPLPRRARSEQIRAHRGSGPLYASFSRCSVGIRSGPSRFRLNDR